MKYLLTAIIALMLCSAAVAAPDVPGALADLEKAKNEVAAAKMVTQIAVDQLLQVDKSAADQQVVIQGLKDDNARLQGIIDHDKKAHVTQMCWGIGLVNGLCWAGAIACSAMGIWYLAIRLGIIAGIGSSIVLAIVYHAPKMATYGFGLLISLTAGGLLYVVYQVYRHKSAAIDLASVPEQLKNAGVIVEGAAAKADAIAKEAVGDLAAKISGAAK